jgi:hypothetical protein
MEPSLITVKGAPRGFGRLYQRVQVKNPSFLITGSKPLTQQSSALFITIGPRSRVELLLQIPNAVKIAVRGTPSRAQLLLDFVKPAPLRLGMSVIRNALAPNGVYYPHILRLCTAHGVRWREFASSALTMLNAESQKEYLRAALTFDAA